jgi:hypothetical protein
MSQLILILSVGLFCILGASGLTTVVNGGQVVITTTVEVPNLRVRITGETTGYVGFGISPEGTMAGADIVLGGYDDVTKLPYGKVNEQYSFHTGNKIIHSFINLRNSAGLYGNW